MSECERAPGGGVNRVGVVLKRIFREEQPRVLRRVLDPYEDGNARRLPRAHRQARGRRRAALNGAGARVLEAGCGTGLILSESRASRAWPRASTSRRACCKKRPAESSGGCQRVHHALPSPNDSFDVCYSFKVLAHVEAISTALAEMARVVRPGGHVLAEFLQHALAPLSRRASRSACRPLRRCAVRDLGRAVALTR